MLWSRVNADGTYSYDPNGQFEALAVGVTATDTFTYTVSDGNGGTDTATVTITLTGVNDAPLAVDDAGATDEDTATAGNVITNDSDVDGDTLSVSEVNGNAASVGNQITLASGALVTVNADGTYSYDPNGQFEALAVGVTATDTFTYTVSDGNGGSDTATVTITLTGINDAPLAVDDAGATDEDTATAGNVITNDSDVDGDTLSVSEVNGNAASVGNQITLASGALVTVNADGTYSYDPNGQFEALAVGVTATDTFTYTVSDGNGGTDTATVTITLTGVNDAPLAVDDAGATDEDAATAGNVITNDSDVDGDTLSVSEVNGNAASVGNQITLASGALVTVNADGTYSYDPNGQFEALAVGVTATDTFTYTVSDGNGGTDTATVTITLTGVNDAPVAADDAGATDEDTATAGNVITNDSDVDGDTLSVSEVNGNAASVGNQITLASGALVTVNADGTYSYDPNGQFEALAVGITATDTFTYTVSDGNGGSDTATVTITLTGVNDAPVAADDAGATDEDTATAGNVITNDSDVDGDTLTVSEVNGNAASVGNQITLASGALVTVNADGTYSYDPNGQFEGLAVGVTATDTFTYTVSDGNGGSDTATVTITLTGVNDAPLAVDDAGATDEDAATAGNVITNDSDPDGDTLSVSEVNGNAASVGNQITLASGALVTVNADGTYSYDPNGQFEALAVGVTATDTFTYTVSDGNGGTDTATVTITLTGVNDAPLAVDDAGATDEDTATAGNVITNDSDVDGDTLSVSEVNGNAASVGNQITLASGALVTVNADGTYSYDPNGQFEALAVGVTATDTFTYTVSDGNGGTDTATVTITLTGVNDAPLAVDDAGATDEDAATAGNVITNDSDVDGDTLSVSEVNGNAASVGNQITLASGALVTVNADGTYSYDPNGQFEALAVGITATDTFTYTVSDGNGGTDTATVTITLTGVNDAPVAADDAGATDEDTATAGNVITNDSDPDGDTLSVSEVNGNAASVGNQITLASGALVTVNADGTYSYDPNGQFEALAVGVTATDTFTYTVSDGNGGTDTATVTITLTGINDAPVAVGDSQLTPEDTPVSGAVSSSDIDGGTPAYTLNSGPSNGSVIVNLDGTYTYTPAVNYTGPDSFVILVSDGNGGTDTAVVSINVNSTNDVPVAVDDIITVSENSTVTGTVAANDSDADGDNLTFALSGLPTMGTLAFNPDGSYVYTPNPDYTGVDTFSYVVSDPSGASSGATAHIQVQASGGADIETLLTLNKDIQIQGSSESDALSDSIATSGVIVETVNDIQSLNGATSLGADGIIIQTANQIDNLHGTGSNAGATDDVQSALSNDSLWQFAQAMDKFNDTGADSWQPQELTGFSLRQPFAQGTGHEDSVGANHIVIDTLVRHEQLFIQVTRDGQADGEQIAEFRFTRADGRALPDWLRAAQGGLLIGNRPVNVTHIDISVTAVLDDGSVQTTAVTIQTTSGEIKLLEKISLNGDLGLTFAEQLTGHSESESTSLDQLAKALAVHQ